jgi:hypothetical protein
LADPLRMTPSRIRYAVRMVKSPGTTAIAVLTIGIATGANATVFGFVSALLLRPAPGVVDPGSLVSVYTSDYSSGPYGSSSYPDYLSLQAEVSAFAQVAAQHDDANAVEVLAGSSAPLRRSRSISSCSASDGDGQTAGGN